MEKLRIASVAASEILSREELKRVFGGEVGSSVGSGVKCYITECNQKDPKDSVTVLWGWCTTSCVCEQGDGTILRGGICAPVRKFD